MRAGAKKPASFAIRLLLAGWMMLAFAQGASAQTFAHPGLLHTEADFNRMKTKVDLGAQPWLSGWQALTSNGYSQLGATPRAVAEVTRPGNVAQMYIDIYRAYQCALRWKVSGDTRYADQTVVFLNAWSSTMTSLTGNADRFLAAGLHGFQWANVGEIMRTYPGWAPADMARFQNLLLTVFYPLNKSFLYGYNGGQPHNGAAVTNYWSNWDLCNIASMQAIGVFCDRADIYNEAMTYIYQGDGNGAIDRAIYHLHAGNLGQMQESGRDQGHTTLSISLLGTICEMAWNQGVDLYGYRNNRCLAGAEYVFKYNQWQDVPYVPYMWGTGQSGSWQIQGAVSGSARGSNRPVAEMIYNHYVNRLGLAAPFSKIEAEQHRPEGNGGNGDQLGFGTLTFTRDPIATGANPTLTAVQSAGDVILSWWGSAYAPTYNVKRATTPGGPYVTIAAGVSGESTTFTDANVGAGQYYYVVTGVLPSAQETGPSNEVRAAFPAELTTWLKADETSGTTAADSSGKGHNGTLINGPIWTAGKIGNAVSLDGANDYVSLPNDVVSGLGDFTVATWVYWNGGSSWQRIFDFGGKPGSYMFLTPKADTGKARFAIGTVYGYNEQRVDAPAALATGQWVHVAVTLSGRVATLYLNGIVAGRLLSCFLQPCQLAEGPQNWIGRSQYPDPYLNGKVDDFRIYSYALRGQEVYALWGQSSNRAPSFTGEHLTRVGATEDSTYGAAAQTVATSASDPDGNAMTFAKLDGPAWLTVAANGTLSGTPGNGDVGPNTFLVQVTDSTGAGSVTRLHIDVANTNDTPVWSASPLTKRVVTREQPYLGVTLAGDASDVDAGDTLAFSKVSGPAWLNVAADGTLSGTPGVGDVGADVFTVRVTDVAGAFANATLNITVLPFMLRSQYAFEGNANDGISGFHGTATGSPGYTAGRFAQGLAFDGADDAVTLPADVASYRDITIAAFVYWNGGGNNQRIFDFGNNTSQYLELCPNTGGGMRFEMLNAGVVQQLNTTALPTGRWVHVAVTISGNTGTLYVNGSAVATNTSMTINPDDFRPSVNFLGDSQWGADPLLNGKLDDFRIYNYGLSAAEVFDIANPIPEIPSGLVATGLNQKVTLTWTPAQAAQTYTVKRSATSGGQFSQVATGLATPTFTDTGLANGVTYFYVVSATNAKGTTADSAEISGAPSDLLVHLKFDETAGTPAADSSGNGFHATLVNGPTFAAGKINNALILDGADDTATLPGGIADSLTEMTVSAWVWWNGGANSQRICSFGDDANSYFNLSPKASAGFVKFGIRNGSATTEQPLVGTAALATGAWQHVAVTLAGGTGRLYVNGTQVATGAITFTPAMFTPSVNYIGDSVNSNDPSFAGKVDDFRIYSRALSAAEISIFQTLLIAPQNLTATPGPERIALVWDAVPNASSYVVKSATWSGGPYTDLGTVAGTSLTHTGLPQVSRYYIVTAQNLTGPGPDSTEAGATPESPNFTAAELRGGTLAITSEGTAFTMTFPATIVGHTYQLQYRADLTAGDWEDIGSAQPGTGAVLDFPIPFPPGSQGFFRFVVTR